MATAAHHLGFLRNCGDRSVVVSGISIGILPDRFRPGIRNEFLPELKHVREEVGGIVGLADNSR